jgi:hypothetical protein
MACNCGLICRATDPNCEGSQLRNESGGNAGCLVPFVLIAAGLVGGLIGLGSLFV